MNHFLLCGELSRSDSFFCCHRMQRWSRNGSCSRTSFERRTKNSTVSNQHDQEEETAPTGPLDEPTGSSRLQIDDSVASSDFGREEETDLTGTQVNRAENACEGIGDSFEDSDSDEDGMAGSFEP